jgi:transposase
MDMLGLVSLKVLQVKETATDYHIYAETVVRPSRCPHCQTLNPRLAGHGHKQQIFQDTPIRKKRVSILIDRRRYLCRECGRTFLERLAEMDDRHNISKRLRRYIQARSLTGTFASLAREVGLDEKTIRLISKECGRSSSGMAPGESSGHSSKPE